MKQYEPHPAAEIFPMMHTDDLRELGRDIAKHGLKEPVVIYQGKILDGRNRYKACLVSEEAKKQFRTVEVKDKDIPEGPVNYVISLNLNRRHLNTSQRGRVAADAEEVEAMLAKQRKGGRPPKEKPVANLPPVKKVKARDIAGKQLKVSGRTVTTAKKVKAKGSKVVDKAVKDGKLSLNKAAKIVELPKDTQNKVVWGQLSLDDALEEAGKPKPPTKKEITKQRAEELLKLCKAKSLNYEKIEDLAKQVVDYFK